MSAVVNVYEAKSQLSQLIARAERGEEIVIARNGRPVARLVSLSVRRDRTPGLFADQIAIAPDFDAFTEDDDREWYGQ